MTTIVHRRSGHDFESPRFPSCSLCRVLVGWVPVSDPDGPEPWGKYVWRSYTEVTAAGDQHPSLFCEDCYVWLGLVAPAVAGVGQGPAG